MSGRADIYIGFFEAGLSLLDEGGKLCFICADRWMHNQYGAGLRRHVINNFALRALVEVHDADVFDVPVAAYPAITLIERAKHSATALATANKGFDANGAARLAAWIDFGPHSPLVDDQFSARVLDGRFNADESWPSGPPERLHMIALLEARLPSLIAVGVSVGVGMATGADKIYVVRDPGEIERQFVKKAIGPADLRDGSVEWTGRYLVSPWLNDELADLRQFPGLSNYFQEHRAVLERRYVGKRNPNVWWRTIDRPPADEYRGSKLVVADISDRIEPVLDSEGHWPLHSAYFIKSADWDLEVLGGYLLSDVAGAFVEAYSVKMANGHLRISGQYLKKIRIPRYEDVPKAVREELTNAFQARDRARASTFVRELLAAIL